MNTPKFKAGDRVSCSFHNFNGTIVCLTSTSVSGNSPSWAVRPDTPFHNCGFVFFVRDCFEEYLTLIERFPDIDLDDAPASKPETCKCDIKMVMAGMHNPGCSKL